MVHISVEFFQVNMDQMQINIVFKLFIKHTGFSGLTKHCFFHPQVLSWFK